jgi:membrane-bound lytic murein transglycosylase C
MRFIPATLPLLLLLTSPTQGVDDFDAFRQQMLNNHQSFVQQQQNDFEAYKRELLAAFAEYRAAALEVWGDRNTVVPTRNNWVEYSNDRSRRSVVDFERGVVTVEIAVDTQQPIAEAELRNRLGEQIINTLTLPADDRSIVDIARAPERRPASPPRQQPNDAVLHGMVADASGKELAPGEIHRFVTQQITAPLKQQRIVGGDGQTRTVVRAEFPLVPDHIRKRAEKYHRDVIANAERQQIRPEVIYAVMETESFFNPTAKSHIPAFGLMQLVPTSGGRDAYKHLHKVDKAPSDTYLYNPQNNIELGTAYLNLVYYQYLAGIKHNDSRLWCTIAAYNTGSGNVLATFAGRYSQARHGSRAEWRKAAFDRINSMSPEQVYQTLHRDLPYEETRNYIKKVRERMPKYQS